MGFKDIITGKNYIENRFFRNTVERILERVNKIENKIEKDFFILLTITSLYLLKDLITKKEANKSKQFIFYRERKRIDDFKMYRGFRVASTMFMSVFFQINDFSQLSNNFKSKLKKKWYETLEFTVEEKRLAEELLDISQKLPAWALAAYDDLIWALIFEDYPLRNTSNLSVFWEEHNIDPAEVLTDSLYLNEISTAYYLRFQKEIKEDFFLDWERAASPPKEKNQK